MAIKDMRLLNYYDISLTNLAIRKHCLSDIEDLTMFEK